MNARKNWDLSLEIQLTTNEMKQNENEKWNLINRIAIEIATRQMLINGIECHRHHCYFFPLSFKCASYFHCSACTHTHTHQIKSNKRILSILSVMMKMISIPNLPFDALNKNHFLWFYLTASTSIRQYWLCLYCLCLHFCLFFFTLSKSHKQNEKKYIVNYVARPHCKSLTDPKKVLISFKYL